MQVVAVEITRPALTNADGKDVVYCEPYRATCRILDETFRHPYIRRLPVQLGGSVNWHPLLDYTTSHA